MQEQAMNKQAMHEEAMQVLEWLADISTRKDQVRPVRALIRQEQQQREPGLTDMIVRLSA